jgi:mono/diheme cytochrome c family protein
MGAILSLYFIIMFESEKMKIRPSVKLLTATLMVLAALAVFYPSVRAGQAERSVWDGVYTEEQAKRGEALCSKECASCHGAALTGGEEAPPLAGPAFLANWEGLSVGDLFERVRISMPPNKQGRLSRQQIADILSHVLRVNNFPTGQAELDTKTEVLKQIRIESRKPKS